MGLDSETETDFKFATGKICFWYAFSFQYDFDRILVIPDFIPV